MDLFEKLKVGFNQLVETFSPALTQFWDLFQDYAYLRAGLVAIIFYFVARLLAHFIPVGIHALFTRLRIALDKKLLKLIRFPLFYLTFIIGLIVAVKVFDLDSSISTALISILKSVLIAVLAISIYRFSIYFLERTAANPTQKTIIQKQTLPLFNNAILVTVLIVATHQIFSVWNVDMTALLASAGIAGLAIGMASKDTLSDIIAGLLILTDNPFKIGDFIELDNHTHGTVTHIGIRSTRIKTKDNVEVVIPNSEMGNRKVNNESSVSSEDGLRIKLDIRTAYGVDVAQIRQLILSVVDKDPAVIQDKKKTVILAEFEERFMTFRLLCMIDCPLKRLATMARIREEVYMLFTQQEIDIALPSKNSIAISEQPETLQQIAITEIPDLKQDLSIQKVPNLFGQGTPKKMTSTKPKPSLSTSAIMNQEPINET